MKAFLTIFLSFLLCCPLAAQGAAPVSEVTPGQILESSFVVRHSLATIDDLIEGFYEADQVQPAHYDVDEYRIRFSSTYGSDQTPIEIVAQFFVPHGTEGEQLPVFVFGAGSSGIDDACAPSLEQPAVQNWGSYKLFMLSIATQGYIAILPDYAGFNDPERIQPYYVSEMAGRVLLDASRAVYRWFERESAPVAPTQTVILSGYSQGGQSIFAAKDMWADYAPDVPLSAVVGYAPVTNMASHMMTLPQLAPYRIYAWADYYGADQVDISQVLTDHWLPTLEDDVLSKCVFDAAGYFSANPAELYRPEFLEALQNGTLEETYPTIAALLDLNSPGFVTNDVPAFILQGTEDRTIPLPVHEAFVERYCAAGNVLTERLFDGANHFHMREISYQAVLDWMSAIAQGQTPQNDCG